MTIDQVKSSEQYVSSNNFSHVPSQEYAHVRPSIKSGDILLCSGSSTFSKLIQQTTNSIWSHVAFIIYLQDIDRFMVLESVESIGVRAVPLRHYVENYNGTQQGYPGRILIARHNQFDASHINKLSAHAVDLLGYPYHTKEILQIATKLLEEKVSSPKAITPSTTSKSYICSEYAYECYRSVGIDIHHDPAGFITPSDFSKDPNITALSFINTSKTS
jgi:hypothetical protein